MERKKRLRIIQIFLLIIGTLVISYTYLNLDKSNNSKIISSEKQKKIKEQSGSGDTAGKDIFYNIEYTGLDLTGNRYILKAKEAYSSKSNSEIVKMKSVQATFYFKDDTVLYVQSEKGIYNNKSLDMKFELNVKADYEGSKLFAQKAEYSNSNSFLTISDNVKINDYRGSIIADKLLFDIKKQKLNIASFNDGKINANVKLK